MTENWSF